MISIQAHFDGKVIVPHGEVDLPLDRDLILRIEPVAAETEGDVSVLLWLAENAVDNEELPADLSHQHDHYLYGSPKRR
jgi:hypothetical protein